MTLDGGRVGYIEAAGFMCPKTEIASPAPRVYLYLGGNQFVWSVYWLCHPESAPVPVPACPSDALFACITGLNSVSSKNLSNHAASRTQWYT